MQHMVWLKAKKSHKGEMRYVLSVLDFVVEEQKEKEDLSPFIFILLYTMPPMWY